MVTGRQTTRWRSIAANVKHHCKFKTQLDTLRARIKHILVVDRNPLFECAQEAMMRCESL